MPSFIPHSSWTVQLCITIGGIQIFLLHSRVFVVFHISYAVCHWKYLCVEKGSLWTNCTHEVGGVQNCSLVLLLCMQCIHSSAVHRLSVHDVLLHKASCMRFSTFGWNLAKPVFGGIMISYLSAVMCQNLRLLKCVLTARPVFPCHPPFMPTTFACENILTQRSKVQQV